ncbi:hypothetical protein HD554DRAFT_2035660 [Boletus coccyginus]|nr:hypothetical protein HD554DRAFT_2035660 [Boletus coccyginus]
MFPERLWAAFELAPWEDVLRFHARLLRCLLLGLLDAHNDLHERGQSLAKGSPTCFSPSAYTRTRFPPNTLPSQEEIRSDMVTLIPERANGARASIRICPTPYPFHTRSPWRTLISQEQLPMHGVTLSLVFEIIEAVGRQASMPGAWFHEQNMLEESILDTVPRLLYRACAQMEEKTWAHLSGLTFIFTALNHSSDDVVTVGRKSQDGRFPVCQGPGLDEFDLDVPTAINETEELNATSDRLPFEFDVHIRNPRESNTATHGRRYGLSAMGDVTTPTPVTTLDIVLASEDGSDGSLFGIGTRGTGGSPLERQEGCRDLGGRQGGALPDTGSPLLLRRARNETGDDSYWIGASRCEAVWRAILPSGVGSLWVVR